MSNTSACYRPIKMWAIKMKKGPQSGNLWTQGYALPRLFSTRKEAEHSMKVWHMYHREWEICRVNVSVTDV